MDRNGSAGHASVISKGVHEIPDLSQGERSTLGEEAHTARADVDVGAQADLAADALVFGTNTGAYGDLGRTADAHDVIAAIVDGVGVLVGGFEDIMPQLQNASARVKSREAAEAGASAVDSKCARVHRIRRVRGHVGREGTSHCQQAVGCKDALDEGRHVDGEGCLVLGGLSEEKLENGWRERKQEVNKLMRLLLWCFDAVEMGCVVMVSGDDISAA